MVALELTIEEAEAALCDLGRSLLSSQEDACDRFETKLRQAILIERGASGAHEDMEALAKHLMARDVRVTTTHGETVTGRLARMSGFRTIILTQDIDQLPISLSEVAAIEPLGQVA